MALSDTARLLIQGIAFPLGVIIALQAVWAIARLCLVAPSRAAVRVIAGRLASTVATGGDVGATLLGLQAQIRWPYPRRIRRAVAALGGERPSTLVAALLSARLLPRELAASAHCAEASGHGPLARFFAELAGARLAVRSPWTAVAPYLGVVLTAIASLTFITVMILPKFEMIFKDLGAKLPGRTETLLSLSRATGRWWPLMAILALAAGLGLVVALRHWTWRRVARRARALAILAGVAGGESEAAIASRLAAPSVPKALAVAGAGGDFRALCAACGWAAATPTALAAAVASEESRQRWRAAIGTIAVQILTPLALAIPVWFILSSIFAALVAVMNAIDPFA